MIAELERDNRRLLEELATSLATSRQLLERSLDREQGLAALIAQSRERELALILAHERDVLRREFEQALGVLRRDFETSTSWRLSAPVRMVGRLLSRMRHR